MNLPDNFYKYRSIDDARQQSWLRDTIQNNTLYWATPSEFNDPFDCAPVYRMPTERQRRQMLPRVVQHANPSWNRVQRKAEERRLLSLPNSILQQRLQIDLPSLMEESAVYSVATQADNVLMWSHYGGAHKGICLQF
jgi:hypothetical protein